ncbi:hypothetical protein ACKVMW_07435 [Vibrio chagasii]|uniref:hypothetical protein n=1 Tax=Vibrio chagasii TaxID=170679 RepID=UPI003DA18D37
MSNESSFYHLLQAYEEIKIENGCVLFSECEFKLEIDIFDPVSTSQRCIAIKLSLINEGDEGKFKSLLKLIKEIMYKVTQSSPEVVWDDLASNLCEKAYPKIHYSENLLRRLITTFMVVNVGFGWHKKSVPDEVNKTIKSNNKKVNENYLYELDFIQLSNLLFNKYTKVNVENRISEITKSLENKNEITSDDIKKIKDVLPESNWQRYFKPIINCDDSYLIKKWEDLYQLRCKVAHNRFLSECEFDDIETLTKELNEKFEEALSNIRNVIVSEDDRDRVAENIISNSSPTLEVFLESCKSLDKSLSDLKHLSGFNKDATCSDNFTGMIDFFKQKSCLNDLEISKVINIFKLRGNILSNIDFSSESQDLTADILIVQDLIETIEEYNEGLCIGHSRMQEYLWEESRQAK